MVSPSSPTHARSTLLEKSEPAWDIARLFPPQGAWEGDDYLQVSQRTNQVVELVRGRLEIPYMPTLRHQRVLQALFLALRSFISARQLGELVVAPYPFRLADNHYREPDLLFVSASKASRMTDKYTDVADLVIEVVSNDRRRDLVDKRSDYAAAGVPEYWIVDPDEQRITVLKLTGNTYTEHASLTRGEHVTSVLFPDLELKVGEVLA